MKVSETRDYYIDLYQPGKYAVRRKADDGLELVETSLTLAVLEAQAMEKGVAPRNRLEANARG